MRDSKTMKFSYMLLCMLVVLPLVYITGCGGVGVANKSVPTGPTGGNGVAGPYPATFQEAKTAQDQWFSTYTDKQTSIGAAKTDLTKKTENAKNIIKADASQSTSSNQRSLAAKAGDTRMPLVMLPKSNSLGNPKGIYVMKEEMIHAAVLASASADVVSVMYGNGIDVAYEPVYSGKKPDYKRKVAQILKNQKSDSGKHVGDAKVVSIHGFEGQGIEPGYDNYTELGKHPRSAYLEWTDNNATYIIKPNLLDQTTSLSKLIEIANSMYK